MTKGSGRSSRQRAATRRRERERRRRLINIAIISVVVIAVGVGIGLAIARGSDRPGEFVEGLGNVHIEPPTIFEDYNSTPPTSGPHYGNLTEWGVHSEQIPNELQVHNLEDGGVGIQFDCPEGCPELVAQLEGVLSRFTDRVFIGPYADMNSTIVLTAWSRIDEFDEFDEQRIIRFVNAYRNIDHHSRS